MTWRRCPSARLSRLRIFECVRWTWPCVFRMLHAIPWGRIQQSAQKVLGALRFDPKLTGESRSRYRLFVVEDGLMASDPDTADVFRRSAASVDRVLKVQDRPTCRYNSRPSSSSSSTSRPPKRLG